MSEPLNSRSDAKLKRLPLPLMAQFVAMLGMPGVSQQQALEWLAQQPEGCKSSTGALSLHFSWLVARVNAWHREQRFLAEMASEKEAHPDVTDAEIFRRGQRRFATAAIADGD
ncbi:MAG TPA: hypothetical protein VMB21_02080, partial [Candidatus Limnocylindria bacterium]|nr:hypothetical protein [Candidatus Limnocylindria bacterium]